MNKYFVTLTFGGIGALFVRSKIIEYFWPDTGMVVVSQPASESLQWKVFLWGFSIIVLLALLGAVMRFLIVPAINARERIHYDPQTGMLPLVRRNVAPIWKQLLGHNEYDELDGNLAATPHRKVWSNGKMSVVADTHGASIHEQLDYARGSWLTQSMVAKRGSDGRPARGMTHAEARLHSGEYSARKDEYNARTQYQQTRMRILEDKYQRAQAPAIASEPQLQLPALHKLTIADTLERSTPGIIEIGQAVDYDQSTATIDFNDSPYILIGGKTRIGKTTTAAFHLVLACLYWHWPVTVFEPPEKRDWQNSFGRHINYHKIDADNAIRHIEMVVSEYDRRAKLLEVNDIVNWQDAPEICPPWVVVWEELGALREKFSLLEDESEGKELLRRFDASMKVLLKQAANTGLIMIGVDQYPQKYNPAIRGQMTKVAFYMGGMGLGNIMDSPQNHKINEQKGMFDRGKVGITGQPVFYQGFHVKTELQMFLDKIPLSKPLPLLVGDGCCSVRKGVSRGVSVPVSGVFPGSVPPVAPPVFSQEQEQMSESKWRLWVEDYAEENPTILHEPPTGIRALGRAMSKHATGSEDLVNNYVGMASRICKEIRGELAS